MATQITLNLQQSKALEAISQSGGYASLENAIDIALVLLADDAIQKTSKETPKYLNWLEQTRLKIEEGMRDADQGSALDANDVIAQLREKVSSSASA